MEQYNVLKEIAYRWKILNRYEETMILATKHPEQWKQNWSMFVAAFNKRFEKQYIIRESETDNKKCDNSTGDCRFFLKGFSPKKHSEKPQIELYNIERTYHIW